MAGTIAKAETAFDLGEVVLILGGVIFLAYYLRKGLGSIGSDLSAVAASTKDFISNCRGTGIICNITQPSVSPCLACYGVDGNTLADQALALQGLGNARVNPATVVPGTGLTIVDLTNAGYSQMQIAKMIIDGLKAGVGSCSHNIGGGGPAACCGGWCFSSGVAPCGGPCCFCSCF